MQSEKFIELLNESVSGCTSKHIALSGGVDSSVIAHCMKKQKPLAYAVIAKDFVAKDLTYCQMIAINLDLTLEIIKVDTEQVISAVDNTIKILQNFNDIEIRNAVVMYIVLDVLKKRGVSSVITGDGADELFAGYNFLLTKSDDDLQKDLERISEIMHFPSKTLGRSLGIKVETPFLSDDIREFAKNLPLEQKIGVRGGVRFGKWIIRKSFEDRIPPQIAWRPKAPMQDGAGTVGLIQLFESLISDKIFLQRQKKIRETDGVNIRTKESLYYYQMYRAHFGAPASDDNNKTKGVCPDCRYVLKQPDSRFCRMCGRYPI